MAISKKKPGTTANNDYTTQFTSTIQYSRRLLREIGNIQCEEGIYDDFWPQTRQVPPDRPNVVAVVEPLASVAPPYVGPLKDKPLEEFDPFKDVKKGMFVLARPSEATCPTWLGYTTEEPQLDDTIDDFETVQVTWWVPDSYVDCWWKRWAPTETSDRIHIESIDYAWYPSNKK